MNIEVITTKLELRIFGYSGIAANQDYAGTAFKLSGRMWQTVKGNEIKNKGKNIWVYEPNYNVFAGIELEGISNTCSILQQKDITLVNYTYYKHVGAYSVLKQVGENMRTELRSKVLEPGLPYIEIYGHWTKDESKCETELLMCLV